MKTPGPPPRLFDLFKGANRLHAALPSFLFSLFLMFSLFPPVSFAENTPSTLDSVVLQLKWKHQFQFAGYYAAAEKGYYRDAGLDVTILEMAPGGNVNDIVLSGKADFGVGNAQVLIDRLQGAPLVVLAVIFQHSAFELLAIEGAGIETPHDLIGKRVLISEGVTPLFKAMIRREGVSPESILMVPYSKWRLDALARGICDAFGVYAINEPFYYSQIQLPVVSIKPRTYGVDFYEDNLFTTEKIAINHAKRTERFRTASLKGWRYAMDQPVEIIELLISKYGCEKSRAHLAFESAAMEDLIFPELIEIGHMNPGRWRHMAEAFVDLGMADTTVITGFLFDPEKQKQARAKKRVLWLGALAALSLFMLAFFYIWNRTLQGAVKKKTRELQTAQEHLQAIAAGIPGAVYRFVKTARGGFQVPFISESASSLLEKPVTALQEPSQLFENVHPDDLNGLWTSIKKSAESMTLWCHEFRIVKKDGGHKWLRGVSQPSRLSGGSTCWNGLVLDITEQKSTETALADTLKWYRLLAENVQDIIWVCDKDFRLTYVSPSVEQTLGYNPEQLVGRLLEEGVEESFLPAMRRAPRKINRPADMSCGDAGVSLLRLPYRHRDGRRVWLETNAKTVEDAAGSFAGLIGCTRDVTRQKQVEQALEQSELRYRTVVEDQTEVISRFRKDGTFLFVNELYCKFFKKRREELINNFWQPVAVFEDLPHIEAKLGQLTPENPVVVIENRVHSGAGDIRWMEFVNRAFFDETGEISEIQSVGRDITARKTAEREAHRLRTILSHAERLASVGAWEWNPATDEWRMSPNWFAIHGVAETPMATAELWKLAHPEDIPRIRKAFQDIKENGVPYNIRHRIIRPDTGETRYIQAFGEFHRNDAGHPSHVFVGAARDITEEVLAEETRIEAERYKRELRRLESLGAMSGGIAHDFNNLLTIVMGNIDLAEEDLPEDAETRKFMENARGGVKRAVDLVSRILTYTEKGPYNPRVLNINDLIAKKADHYRSALINGVSPDFQFAPGLPEITADPEQINQMIAELITNAAESCNSDPPGTVTVATGEMLCGVAELAETVYDIRFGYEKIREKERFVYIQVTDDGCGMDEDVLNRLFEPFFTTKFFGRGLGLPVVAGIVRKHKGYIRVDSASGKGSTFRVLLPVTPKKPSENPPLADRLA